MKTFCRNWLKVRAATIVSGRRSVKGLTGTLTDGIRTEYNAKNPVASAALAGMPQQRLFYERKDDWTCGRALDFLGDEAQMMIGAGKIYRAGVYLCLPGFQL